MEKLLDELNFLSVDQYDSFIDNLPDALIAVNSSGTILLHNKKALSVFGYKNEELVGQPIAILLPFASRKKHVESVDKYFNNPAMKHMGGVDTPVYGLQKDGTEIALEIELNAYDTSDGKVTISIIRDVTEQMKTREIINKSEEKFNKLFYQSPAGISISRMDDGILLDCNNSYLEMFEYLKEEIIGKSVLALKIVSAETRRKILRDIKQYGRFNNKEIPVTTKSGKILTVLFSSDFIELNNEKCMVNTIIDITERKVAEEKQKQTDFLLTEAQLIAKTGNWNFDFLTKEVFWSEGIRKIYGVDMNFEASYDAFVSLLHPEDRERTVFELNDAMKSGRPSEDEFRIVRPNGEIRDVDSKVRFALDKNGKSLRIFGTYLDITEQKLAERKLEQQNEELVHINNELDRFVYSTTHEIRSPLTSILGLISLINLDKLDKPNHEIIDLIKICVYKMDETIHDIHDYSKNSRNDILIEEIHLKEMIMELFKNHFKTLEGFELDKKLSIKGNTKLLTDKTRLRIILTNLISNSIKYRNPETKKLKISMLAEIDEERLVFNTSDNGIGINKDDLPNIFGMFVRATNVGTGTGLGLYILKECIDKLNGKVYVESETSKGTKFTVEIPNGLG